MPGWVWSGLRTARGELRLAFESVIEDLESLTPQRAAAIDAAHAACAAECDSESMRVDDMAPPPPRRAEYEQETFFTEPRCEDFELIDKSLLDDRDMSWVMVPRKVEARA